MEIRYFSWLRNKVGKSNETLHLPEKLFTVYDLMEFLSMRENCNFLMSHIDVIKVSLNGEVIDDLKGQPIGDSDTVSFFVPMAGG